MNESEKESPKSTLHSNTSTETAPETGLAAYADRDTDAGTHAGTDAETDTDADLERAAQEWREDPVPKHRTKKVRASTTTTTDAAKSKESKSSTLILDPYGFRSEEVLSAQRDEEFTLGEDDAFETAIHEPALRDSDSASPPLAEPLVAGSIGSNELREDIVGREPSTDRAEADERRTLELADADSEEPAEEDVLDIGAIRRKIQAQARARELEARATAALEDEVSGDEPKNDEETDASASLDFDGQPDPASDLGGIESDLELEHDPAFESTAENDAETDRVLENLAGTMQTESAKYAAEMEAALADDNAEEVERLRADSAEKIAEDEALESARLAAASAEDEGEEMDPDLRAALPKNPADRFNAPETEGGSPHPESTLAVDPETVSDSDLADLESTIETLLFMSEKPLGAVKLQELLGPEIAFNYFQEALTNLKTRYKKEHHGFELIEVAGGFQFRTKPLRAALAKKLARVHFQRLSSGAMETLAILAYRQPALKETVDEVRGVDSSHFIRTLLDRKLIRISGRSELPGRPMLYETTEEFLQIFSLNDLSELPPLSEIEQMVPTSQSDHEEDPRIKQMRKLVADMKADASVSLLYDPKEDEQFLKDIRERVKSIEVSTPSLDAEDEARRLASEGGKAPGLETVGPAPGSVTGEQLPFPAESP